MQKVVIGIGGEKGSGKDTASQKLLYEFSFMRVSFAEPLKEVCAEAFELELFELNDPVQKDKPYRTPYTPEIENIDTLIKLLGLLGNKGKTKITSKTISDIYETFEGKQFTSHRDILQFVGTDIVRNLVDDEFWIKVAQWKIEKYPRVVITDMRFENERDLITKLGGKKILIERNQGTNSKHVSEKSLGSHKDYDLVIKNNSDIEALQENIEEFYICSVKGYGSKRTLLAGAKRLLKSFFSAILSKIRRS